MNIAERRPDIIQSFEILALERSGSLCPSSAAWFDGFWDFFTTNRKALELSPGVAGADPQPWLVLCWETEGRLAIEIFVESKDYRPGAVAPWPVSSIYLNDGSPVPPSKLPQRATEPLATQVLSASGFSVTWGYWGVRATLAEVGSHLDAELIKRALDAARRIVSQPSPSRRPAARDRGLRAVLSDWWRSVRRQ